MSSVQDKNKADELFTVAYNECYSLIYRFVASRLSCDPSCIDDCVQDTFVVLYKSYLSGTEIVNTKAYLLKTANNFVHKYYDKIQKSNQVVDIDDVKNIPVENDDIDERLSFEQYSRQISAALNETDAKLFELRFVQDLKITQIAEITGMSVPAITTRISRMKQKLKNILADMIPK